MHQQCDRIHFMVDPTQGECRLQAARMDFSRPMQFLGMKAIDFQAGSDSSRFGF